MSETKHGILTKVTKNDVTLRGILKEEAWIDDGEVVSRVETNAFHGIKVAVVNIPEGVKALNGLAFGWKDSITRNFSIPASLENIAPFAFAKNKNLETINVDKDNNHFKIDNGALLSKDGTKLYQYPTGKKDTTWCVPDSVNTIKTGAFADCKNLQSVEFSIISPVNPSRIKVYTESGAFKETGFKYIGVSSDGYVSLAKDIEIFANNLDMVVVDLTPSYENNSKFDLVSVLNDGNRIKELYREAIRKADKNNGYKRCDCYPMCETCKCQKGE